MSMPELIVEVAWAFEPLQVPPSGGYTNISAYVLTDPPPSFQRGRQSELDTTQAGRLTLTLDNQDRRFDPDYSAGPYYGYILPRKRIRVRAVWNSVSYTLFTGFIDTLVPSVRAGRNIVTLTASDALAFFARQILGGEVLYSGTAAYNSVLGPIIPRMGHRKIRITGTGISGVSATVTLTGERAPSGPTDYEIIDVPLGDSVQLSVYSYVFLYSIQIVGFGGSLTIEIADDFPQEFSNWSIRTILDTTGWPASERELQNGLSLIQSYAVSGSPALRHLQQITLSENGALFATRGGKIRFDNRHHRLSLAATETYDDDGATSGLPYADIRFEFGERFIYNDIRLSRTGGSEITARDQGSITNYWWSSLPSRELLITSDTELANAARWLLAQYKDPATRVAELRLNGALQPSTLWPKLLGADLQHVINVKRTPPGGGAAILKESVIESIAWTFSPTRWDCRWGLSPCLGAQYWRLGVSQLGTNTRLPY